MGKQGVIPKNLIAHVTGNLVINERQVRVFPLTKVDFPDDSIVESSQSLINNHSRAFHAEQILEQVKIIDHVSH